MKGLYAMDAAERIAIFCSPEPFSGCWLWMAGIARNGYGYLSFRGTRWLAHRISYEAHVGVIPEGLDLDHLCRNRSCVNPVHLEPVTRKVNLGRSSLIGRGAGKHQSAKTHCPQGHEYTPENTRQMKQRKGRICRECDRIRNRREA